MENSAPEKQKPLKGFYSMSASSSYSVTKYYHRGFTEGRFFLTRAATSTTRRYTHSLTAQHTATRLVPTFVCTAAQTNLLLAEAAYRGWINGDAKTFYEAGVRCAMKQFNTYPSANAKALCGKYLTDDAINAYLAANPFKEAEALKQINTQYWITCFCDEYESYANWRRSGYPELQEMCSKHENFNSLGNWGPGIVRRMPYPSDEVQINT